MNVKQLLSKYLSDVTPTMHKVRRLSLFAAVESTINGGALSVTGLGRNIDSRAYEKHRIKRKPKGSPISQPESIERQ
jgi:hypothetical protein